MTTTTTTAFLQPLCELEMNLGGADTAEEVERLTTGNPSMMFEICESSSREIMSKRQETGFVSVSGERFVPTRGDGNDTNGAVQVVGRVTPEPFQSIQHARLESIEDVQVTAKRLPSERPEHADIDYDSGERSHDGMPVDDDATPRLVHHLASGNVSTFDSRSVCAQLGLTTTAKDHGHVGGLLAGKIGKNKFGGELPVGALSARHHCLRCSRRVRALSQADYALDSRSKCRYSKCASFIAQGALRIGKIPPSIK